MGSVIPRHHLDPEGLELLLVEGLVNVSTGALKKGQYDSGAHTPFFAISLLSSLCLPEGGCGLKCPAVSWKVEPCSPSVLCA